jgi:oligopeptide/dipeptide ABC transporter ATP-binding protein
MSKPVMKIRGLKTYFFMERGTVKAVDGVDLDIGEKQILGLVGETGCGKSVAAHSVLRLVPYGGSIVSGKVLFGGRDLLKLSDEEMRKVRGYEIAMIFQDPETSLDPVYTLGYQIAEPIELHQVIEQHLIKREEVPKKVLEAMKTVAIPDPKARAESYPHQLSGGMKQRGMIAMMITGTPKLLVADEPTTALDVTVQAQILDLMRGLREKLGTSIFIITHDLAVVAELCDRVAVMYAGQLIEVADVLPLFEQPLHPYTQVLVNAIPKPGVKRGNLETIPPLIPNLMRLPKGCRFHPRCPKVMDKCRKVRPKMIEAEKGHRVRCHLYD